MYRLINTFEFRGGASYIKGEFQPSGGLSILLTIGMMQYRLDGGVLFQGDLGPVFNGGLTVRF
jgi:hypothetical protein